MSRVRPIGTVYTATVAAVAVTAAQDVFEIVSPSTSRVRIREVRIAQYSDAGDAQAEMLSILVMRGHTTSGSGGSSVTPNNVNHYSTLTASSTVEANNTTVASNGSPVTLIADAWNVQGGWWYTPDENEMIVIDVSTRLVFRITAPADSITLNATLVFEEIGTIAV